MTRSSPADRLFRDLTQVHEILAAHRVWHVIAYGTLLGAVRDHDVIPWDDDFDFFVRAEDFDALGECVDDFAAAGLELVRLRRPANELAVRPPRLRSFDGSIVSIFAGKRRVGDLFLVTLFSDGVLRRYDFDDEIYWAPHMSFPHFFVDRAARATIRGKRFPAIVHARKWLSSLYGDDWRTPARSVNTGGQHRPDRTVHGHIFEPHLAEDIAWCEARGWDRSKYADAPSWPRRIRGAGPIGPTPRTKTNSRALWWRSLKEVVRYF